MKIAVTGSDSFLAYHLIKKLLERGHNVRGCDLKRSQNTLDLISLRKKFEFRECDITEFNEMKNITANADCVYHLAAVSSERFCKENPIKSFDVNVKSILNLLTAAKENNTLFIFSSSGSVYPDSTHPKKEEGAVFGGKFYGTSKLIAEKYCQLFNKQFGLPFIIFRFSRLYGPRMERNPVYDITKGLVNKKKILLYEGLESNYDFIYAEDAADVLLNAAVDSKWKNGIFNISSARGIKLKELLALYFKIVGFDVPVEIKRDVSQTDILDNTKALNLGFSPKTSFEKGLRETFSYFS